MGAPPKPPAPPPALPSPVGELDPLAALATTGHVVTFKLKDVPPPSNLYITPDDFLLIEAITNVAGETVQIRWRTLGTDGYIHSGQDSLVMSTQNAFLSRLISVGEGFLLNLELFNTLTGTRRGALFCAAFLFRGGSVASGTITALLVQDYLDADTTLGWPGGRQLSSIDGPGFIRDIVGTTPAAGAEVSEVVPVGRGWRLQSFHVKLTTAVAVANRQVKLQIADGANVIWFDQVEAAQAASLTVDYVWGGQGGVNQTAIQLGTVSRSLPYIRMNRDWTMKTVTTNLQAADQYSAPVYVVEEWVAP